MNLPVPKSNNPSLPARTAKPASNLAVPEITLSNSQKAAVVLASLSVEIATQVVSELSDKELRAFARAFSGLRSVAPEKLNGVATEFTSAVSSRRGELAAGADEAERILKALTDEERANRLLNGSAGPAAKTEKSKWDQIEEADDEALLGFIVKQKTPIAAAILSRVSSEKSAQLITLAEPDFARTVLIELAKRPSISEAALDAIAVVIIAEVLAPAAARPDYTKGGAVVGEIVNCLSTAKRDALMSELQEADTDISAAVKKVVLTFAELATRLPSAGASTVTREVDRETLLTALKYGQQTAPETVEFIFANISKRMGEQMREEMDEAPELDEETGEAAQRAFMSAIRRLSDAGEIELLDPPPEDEAGAE